MIALKKALLAGASVIALTVAAPAIAATFTFTGAIETGTIDTTGTYRVTLGGASGGAAGGTGGYVLGDIALTAGDPFQVLVGGTGGTGGSANGGGGGLSMFRSGAEIAIAGGGGGGVLNGVGGAGGASIGGFELLQAAPSQVPLPGGMVLFGSALGGLMVMRRRKRAA